MPSRIGDALEAAGTVHPCRLLVLVADAQAAPDSLTARVSVVRSGGAISLERVVLSATGKNAASEINAIFPRSSMPNHTEINGIHAKCETCLMA